MNDKKIDDFKLTESGLILLSDSELQTTDGGNVWLVLGAVASGLAIIGVLAYGAGYVYGKLTCD